VREAAELILKAQGKWNEIVNAYMKQGQGDSQ
jgi:3-deoxy-D-manno-octulosonate 8-phosphate phosphatase KdsC-like HAD superfamily phosphatase